MNIVIVCNSRAERGPLESVIAALPEADVISFSAEDLEPDRAMALALDYFTQLLKAKPSDLVIVLGDRYETLAAALAAKFLRIPIAHIHGGETTTGAFDDALRHSITHLATLHFAPTHRAQQRIFQLVGGTSAWDVGAPGLDGIPQNSAKRDHKSVLVTFHPETMAEDYGHALCAAMLGAIRTSLLGYEIIFCGVNADPGGVGIQRMIEDHISRRGGRYVADMSHAEYVEKMQHAALVIGNSSAGIIEAPWVGVPTLNLGKRQAGRPTANSVMTLVANSTSVEIAEAIRDCLEFDEDPEPIYKGGAAPKIAAGVRAYLKRLAA